MITPAAETNGKTTKLSKQQVPSTLEPRSCVKVEVDVLGSPSLIILMVCGDAIKQHLKKKFGVLLPAYE